MTTNDLIGLIGVILVAVNVCGFVVPLRSPDIDGYRDFAGIATTRFSESSSALRRLSESHATPVDFVTEATRISTRASHTSRPRTFEPMAWNTTACVFL